MLTRMDVPLGRRVGNASEVLESIQVLRGDGPADLEAISVALAARMLVLAGIAPPAEAETRSVRRSRPAAVSRSLPR